MKKQGSYIKGTKRYKRYKNPNLSLEDRFVKPEKEGQLWHEKVLEVANSKISLRNFIDTYKYIVFNRFDDSEKNSTNSRIDSLCNILELQERRFPLVSAR